MLHAIVSDIHGNLEALEAVLADIAPHRPASIVCLGDFVGYGASPYPGVFDRHEDRVRYTRTPEVRLEKGHRYLVNVASVGQPRDGDPRAGYLLYDDLERVLRHVRLEYDLAGAMKRIVDAGLPRFLADRLQWGE